MEKHNHNTTSSFVLMTVSIFFMMALLLFVIDFVPETRVDASLEEGGVLNVVVDSQEEVPSQTIISDTSQQTTHAEQANTVVPLQQHTVVAVPTRIIIDAIGVDTTVLTPKSTDVDVLDRALLSGAVHYPGSAYAGEKGNMLIFGHSSYLPVVRNKAFQAFNELGTLKPGEQIAVHTETHIFTYTIEEVRLARAEEVVIEFGATQPTLTLATCNTFGAKQERWVVRAVQQSVAPR